MNNSVFPSQVRGKRKNNEGFASVRAQSFRCFFVLFCNGVEEFLLSLLHKKFDSLVELQAQLEHDREEVSQFLSSLPTR